MSRECKLFCEGIARGELIVGKEGGNKNGENSVQIYLKCKKKKKAVGILVQSLTEPDAFTSKSLKGSIVYKVS